MRTLVPTLALAVAVSIGGCARSGRLSTPAPTERTVLKVENRGFPDMNVFVVAEASTPTRLGTVTGNSTAYFVLPEHLLRGSRAMRFQARPIATQRGPVSEEIMVTPGDTVTLVIPPQ